MARKAFRAYALVGALLGVGYFLLPKGGAVYDVWYLCVGASSVAAIVLGVHLNTTRAAGAWYLIALGQLFFVACTPCSARRRPTPLSPTSSISPAIPHSVQACSG